MYRYVHVYIDGQSFCMYADHIQVGLHYEIQLYCNSYVLLKYVYNKPINSSPCYWVVL